MYMKTINFANNLRILRKSKGLTQEELGAMLGVNKRTVSVWEIGKCEPSLTMLAKLCEIFDETFDDILT